MALGLYSSCAGEGVEIVVGAAKRVGTMVERRVFWLQGAAAPDPDAVNMRT